MRYLTYVDKDTFLHKLDPRTKFVFLIVMAVLTSVVKTAWALAFLLVFFLILWISAGVMKEMAFLAKQLKAIMIFLLILWFILGMFQEPQVEGPVFLRTEVLGIKICIDWYDIYKGFASALRLYLMVSSFFTVLISTNFSEIILGLSKWHFPYSLSYGIGLVFQVIPIVISELNTIMEAESSRGLEIEQCKWTTKIKNYLIFAVPLFFRVLNKGHAISLGMHYYKLNFNVKRTSYKTIKPTVRDLIFALVTLVAVAGTIVLHVLFYIPLI
ncbi:MAG: energy-coupling factor transporter transmembrane protein EcfT [Christensenellaceae bacterium]|nr:energy-coupling factor transporter transmembrane protein EcfT [Christensenellaceae bacterium]